MNKQLLKDKIELTCLSYSTNALLFIKREIDHDELDKRNRRIINELYRTIASMEPTNESEVV